MQTGNIEVQDRAAPRVNLWQTMGSVLAAFFGVQSTHAYYRDFNGGNALSFILIGVAMTAAFIGILLGIVKLILHNAA